MKRISSVPVLSRCTSCWGSSSSNVLSGFHCSIAVDTELGYGMSNEIVLSALKAPDDAEDDAYNHEEG